MNRAYAYADEPLAKAMITQKKHNQFLDNIYKTFIFALGLATGAFGVVLWQSLMLYWL